MELEKLLKTEKQDDVNVYTELFSKKEDTINTSNNETVSTNNENIKKEETKIINEKNDFKNVTMNWKDKFSNVLKKTNIKNLTIGFLVGIIANISYYHYDTVQMQAKSQRFANGLMYNLAETNDLNQIATNIYLGMKDAGWEPVVKISNDKIFAFNLEGGGEFVIVKNSDLVSTKFHITIKDFSKEMVKALRIQTEANKIGGTSIFIGNKDYSAEFNEISFDFNKIGYGTLPEILTVPTPISPSVLPMPPLPNIDPGIISKVPNVDSKIIKNDKIVNIPISDQLSKNLNPNIDSQLTTKQKQELDKLTDENTKDLVQLTKKQTQELDKLTDKQIKDLDKLNNKFIENSTKIINAEKKN